MWTRAFVSGVVGATLLASPLLATPAIAAPAASPAAPQVATIYYDVSGAPTFRDAIRAGLANWNASVHNVQFKENSANSTLRYTEGNDAQNGSHANTDGHGHGTIFIDYTQARQYDQVRITAHESGHALGLPDHYSGPCSELMSGGGPGPTCHNARPNADEIARVEGLWANGLAASSAPTLIYN
ncbi:MAG: snapalysin family zinc-dependent metalloprotease [Kutzneria sp.]|nr:snapalysin family zinc-dependent metalloprotease [Kutzneria sp.]